MTDTSSDRFVEMLRAESIIQRDAILAALDDVDCDYVVVPRDISRKMFDGSVDLAYGGVSAVFDGFPIMVRAKDLDRARAVAKRVLDSADALEADLAKSDTGMKSTPRPRRREPSVSPYFNRYYRCALYSLIVPGVFHLVGFWSLLRAIQNREIYQPRKMMVALLVYAVSAAAPLLALLTLQT
jgi:hypothetical protein